MEKIYLTPEKIHTMMSKLCAKIIPIREKFDRIVGIERGGIPISSWLAYVLDKKHSAIGISLYGDGDKITGSSFSWGTFHPSLATTPFLLVDDIVDSGGTIKIFRQNFRYEKIPQFWIASLHWCPQNSPDCEPDFYVETKTPYQWVIYPWEVDYKKSLDKAP